MSIKEYQVAAVTDFRGPRLREEPLDLTLDAAIESVNTVYNLGRVETRTGFSQVWNPNEQIWSMYNWVKGADSVSTAGNYLFYYSPVSGKVRYVPNLASPSPVDLFTVASGAGAIHANAGSRLYTTVYNSSGEGIAQARVSGGFDTGTVVTDKCFSAPMSSSPTLTEPSSGLCTAGLHRVGYYILSRSGFRGKLAPYSGGAFNPATITSSGDKNIQFSMTATWPSDALSIWVVMTPASNLNKWILVPGATASVTAGGSSTVGISLSISDDDLVNTGTEVTDYQLWLTQDSGGTGPFNPSHVVEVSSRMGYITRLNGVSEAYFSEPEQFQQITADQHVVRLPGQRQMTTAFTNGNAVYILGPSWTYGTTDTGERPVLWPTPELIDGNIGTPSPTGATFDASRNRGFVADQGGLYLFSSGAYSEKPLSYGVASDWKRINWNYGYFVKVVDDKDNNRVLVSAPIDGGTAPNAVFVFDYSDGLTHDRIRYSFWTINNYYTGSICSVLNPTTKRREIWVGSATTGGTSITGKVLRQKNTVDDGSPYNDEGDGISWIYESAPFPRNPMGTNAHHMLRMRILGSGTATLNIHRLDHVSSIGPYTLTLSATPNTDLEKQFYLTNTPAITYRFTGSTADSYMKLSKIEHRYNQFSS